MVSELLLEIGTEEIPSGYLRAGLNGLERLVKTCLEERRIAVAGGLYSFGTPRRLILIGKAISGKQEDLVQEILGPPLKVAYDDKGIPTKAAIGFAERQGVLIEELQSVNTPKGEYLFIKRKTPGRPVRDILVDALPDLIKGIPWPKSMRWGKTDFPFARPIHWVLALFNGEVISFEVAGVHSGNITRGHRFMAPEFIEVAGVQDYLEKMERSFVLIDQREREDIVESATKEAANYY